MDFRFDAAFLFLGIAERLRASEPFKAGQRVL